MSERQERIQVADSFAMHANQSLHDCCAAKSRTGVRLLLPPIPKKGRTVSGPPGIQNKQNRGQNTLNPWSRGRLSFSQTTAPPLTTDMDLRPLRRRGHSWKDGNPDKRAAQCEVMNRLKNGESPGAADAALGPPGFCLSGRCLLESSYVPWSSPEQPTAPRLYRDAGYPANDDRRSCIQGYGIQSGTDGLKVLRAEYKWATEDFYQVFSRKASEWPQQE